MTLEDESGVTSRVIVLPGISFNPEPTATVDRLPLGLHGLSDRKIIEMIDGRTSPSPLAPG